MTHLLEPNVSFHVFSFLKKYSNYNLIHPQEITSELQLLSSILKRNFAQQRSRKYFRFCCQLCKRIPALGTVQMQNNCNDIIQRCKNSAVTQNEVVSFCYALKDLVASCEDTLTFMLTTLRHLNSYLGECEFVKILICLIAIVSKFYSLILNLSKDVKKAITWIKKQFPLIFSIVVPSEEICEQSSDEETINENEAKQDDFCLLEDVGEVLTLEDLKNLKPPTPSPPLPTPGLPATSLPPPPFECLKVLKSPLAKRDNTPPSSVPSDVMEEPVLCAKEEENGDGEVVKNIQSESPVKSHSPVKSDLASLLKKRTKQKSKTMFDPNDPHIQEQLQQMTGKERNDAMAHFKEMGFRCTPLKCPISKVYKHSKALNRKLARYSRDSLRVNIPRYSESLYLEKLD